MKEILEEILAYYKEHLIQVKKLETLNQIGTYLTEKKLHYGICYCSQHIFDEFIHRRIEQYKYPHESYGYWYIIPMYCSTKEKVIESMEFRINRIKEILNNLK